VSKYGIDIPSSTPSQYTTITTESNFILPNTEIKEDSLLTGIELYATSAGNFWFEVSLKNFFLNR
jgi:hypothetical protein